MVHYNVGHLDAVFGALADPTRRAVLASLRAGERSVGELAEPFGMSLTGFIKHLAILEDARLIERRKTGRVVSCRLTSSGMKGALEWLRRYEEFWHAQLDRLGTYLDRKENAAWTPQSTNEPASRSGASTTPRSPRSTRRGRTPSK
jgi:DNA-binding transcriptional ArsR family regulator